MIEELLPDLFRIEIPLPDSPLKYLNSYVIRSPERNLVIDTGLNRKECLEAMEAGLEEIKIDLGKTDFFITHLHADHFGLVGKIVTDTSKVFFNRPDSELIESWDGWDPMVEYAPGFKFHSQWVPELSILTDDDTIRTGDYHFRCIETPGHTEGHTCLYEAEKKIFICGDHILIDITPNIQCWSDRENPLKNYLTSLEKVRELDVDLVLPGHRRVFKNHAQRIDELKEHHYRRIEEVLTILNNEAKNAYQVASGMSWDINCDSWEQFPLAQKWFATGEAIAHLRYLEEDRSIFRKKGEEEILFSREPA